MLRGGHLCGRTARLPTERLFGGEGNGDVHFATTWTMDCSQLHGGSLRPNALYFASFLVFGRAIFGNGSSACPLYELIARRNLCFPRKNYWECSPTAAMLPDSPATQAAYLFYSSLFPVLATGAFSGYRQGAHLVMILLARGTRRAPQGTCAKKQHLRIFANKSALFSHPVCPTSRLLQFIAPMELGSFSALKREITFSP